MSQLLRVEASTLDECEQSFDKQTTSPLSIPTTPETLIHPSRPHSGALSLENTP